MTPAERAAYDELQVENARLREQLRIERLRRAPRTDPET